MYSEIELTKDIENIRNIYAKCCIFYKNANKTLADSNNIYNHRWQFIISRMKKIFVRY